MSMVGITALNALLKDQPSRGRSQLVGTDWSALRDEGGLR
jgi:hypothetical protein